jgi:hypothetical protein
MAVSLSRHTHVQRVPFSKPEQEITYVQPFGLTCISFIPSSQLFLFCELFELFSIKSWMSMTSTGGKRQTIYCTKSYYALDELEI